jgi:hypothetical protein
MSETAEAATARLWRDKVEIRERERDEARARARIAEEKVAILLAENDRLAAEIARLRAPQGSNAATAKAEIEGQMDAIRTALSPLLAQTTTSADFHLNPAQRPN